MILSLKKIDNERAFSLIEIVIYVGIVATVLTTVVLFLVNIIKGTSMSNAIQEVQHNISFTSSKVELDIEEASSIDFVNSVLDSDNGKIVINKAEGTVTYEVQDGVLTRLIESAAIADVTSSKVYVTQFRIENRSFEGESGNIEIYITINHKNPASQKALDVTRTYKTSLSVRST
ncbi:MAG: hypothetical protein PHS44_00460 [Candidatus Dojkabacteria bacterium]|jgi:type II secretory pathway pseudopilin PulG|nr:hypothetical protein [Candidatus Dojkabacteria bacterium]